MAQVKFTGAVSVQAQEGETVTIGVAKPDGTNDALMATTAADGTYSVTKEYAAGAYTAKAHIDADAMYKAADSPDVPFAVALADRSLTLVVSIP